MRKNYQAGFGVLALLLVVVVVGAVAGTGAYVYARSQDKSKTTTNSSADSSSQTSSATTATASAPKADTPVEAFAAIKSKLHDLGKQQTSANGYKLEDISSAEEIVPVFLRDGSSFKSVAPDPSAYAEFRTDPKTISSNEADYKEYLSSVETTVSDLQNYITTDLAMPKQYTHVDSSGPYDTMFTIFNKGNVYCQIGSDGSFFYIGCIGVE